MRFFDIAVECSHREIALEEVESAFNEFADCGLYLVILNWDTFYLYEMNHTKKVHSGFKGYDLWKFRNDHSNFCIRCLITGLFSST